VCVRSAPKCRLVAQTQTVGQAVTIPSPRSLDSTSITTTRAGQLLHTQTTCARRWRPPVWSDPDAIATSSPRHRAVLLPARRTSRPDSAGASLACTMRTSARPRAAGRGRARSPQCRSWARRCARGGQGRRVTASASVDLRQDAAHKLAAATSERATIIGGERGHVLKA
jgi:hypothetical protein